MSGVKNLIIDCDPGCDDALAILLAIIQGNSSYDEIIVATVAGNVPVERTTHNARKIVSLAQKENGNKKVSIYRGSAVSLMGNAPNVMSVHGRDGLGDVPDKIYPDNISLQEIEDESAVEFYRSLTNNDDGKIYDLVCTGPLTNLATALSLTSSPDKLLKRFKKIIAMGGAFKWRGNITPTAEFNFYFDPIAVKIVLDYLKKCYSDEAAEKITVIPLNITEKVQLRWEEIDEKSSKQDPIGKWTLCMLQKYFMFHLFGANILKDLCSNYKCIHENISCSTFKTQMEYDELWKKIRQERRLGKSGKKYLPKFCYLHDPLAVYYLMNPNTIYTEIATVGIHTDNDEMRGTVILFDDRASISERKAYTKGTTVRYLSPEKIGFDYIRRFKEMLVEACGLKLNQD